MGIWLCRSERKTICIRHVHIQWICTRHSFSGDMWFRYWKWARDFTTDWKWARYFSDGNCAWMRQCKTHLAFLVLRNMELSYLYPETCWIWRVSNPLWSNVVMQVARKQWCVYCLDKSALVDNVLTKSPSVFLPMGTFLYHGTEPVVGVRFLGSCQNDEQSRCSLATYISKDATGHCIDRKLVHPLLEGPLNNYGVFVLHHTTPFPSQFNFTIIAWNTSNASKKAGSITCNLHVDLHVLG